MTVDDPILVVDYDAHWPRAYARERDRIREAVGDALAGIEHIGSTAVPGLGAKPVIDIMLASRTVPPGRTTIAALEGLGYEYCGELGIPGRHYFRRGLPRTHQIHAVDPDGELWRRHLLFRDYLCAHPEASARYDAEKRRLAVMHRDDRDAYTQAKAPMIEAMLAEAER